ncbi:MAG: T9SS type A sorting domain-containing protein, partial [Candidatus Kapaibacterium sp.]
YHSWSQISLVQDTSVIFQGISYTGSYGSGAVFLPTLGWFLSLAGYESNGPCFWTCIEEQWTMSLISASKVHSSVQSESRSNILLLTNSRLLQLVNFEASNITLMDLLGRVVNAWQFPGSGSRDVTLNVADVPSGIYFLRVSGSGMDKVKKVCIAH